ncbi:MAG: hypothetical protein ACKOBJ_03715 [Actinomycetota bacterium]
MSHAVLEPDLRAWDLDAIPVEVMVSALTPTTTPAGVCASTSCAIAIAAYAGPCDSPELAMKVTAAGTTLTDRVDLRLDIRVVQWWAGTATLLVLGVPTSIVVGPVPRKRHGWPEDYRTSLRDAARELVRGWGDAGEIVRESREDPGDWPTGEVRPDTFVADRTLRRSGENFELVWHLPELPRCDVEVRAGRWRDYLVWHIGPFVSAVKLPPVLARCTLTDLELSRDRWVTRWEPDRSVWPDV